MEQIKLNGFVKALFDGYKEAKSYNHNPFNELENTWRLFSVSELNGLYKEAETKEQHELILDHMYRFDATSVPRYKRIEDKIIERYWEG